MAMDTSWPAEVRWQDTGIADGADPWRARSESRSEASWLSASILHDLRNPVGTIYAGAEMLMTLETTPNQVKPKSLLQHRRPQRQLWIIREFRSCSMCQGR